MASQTIIPAQDSASSGVTRLDFHGYSVKGSPFPSGDDSIVAVASSQYYGLAGNGCLSIICGSPSTPLLTSKSFMSPEGLYDVAWSETTATQLVTCSADGNVCLWDARVTDGKPIAFFQRHKQEATSVVWDHLSKARILSTSWDGTVNIADASTVSTLHTCVGHTGYVNAAEWHPTEPHAFVSAGNDAVRFWDARGE